ncbi:hypothetical protein [Variovorax paradoxus]|uniref:Uncharacterized protein n=1 Tax=Variovorax paradoxus TaxID=34073 RepID=A0A679JAS4_VARPD|nr:hypothetical protein VVAX_04664 [Variovorax paradoxus]
MTDRDTAPIGRRGLLATLGAAALGAAAGARPAGAAPPACR